MKKNLLVIFILFISANYSQLSSNSKNSYFENGKKLFENKKYKNSKFYFEKDIVFNPKSETSYLYLAKIFKKEMNDSLEENNLKTVLLLNPKNEEAIYLLTLLSVKKSNFSKAKKLIVTMTSVCEKMCTKIPELQDKLDSSLKSK
jgi:tetratricopeptide (TPR) repeat protein